MNVLIDMLRTLISPQAYIFDISVTRKRTENRFSIRFRCLFSIALTVAHSVPHLYVKKINGRLPQIGGFYTSAVWHYADIAYYRCLMLASSSYLSTLLMKVKSFKMSAHLRTQLPMRVRQIAFVAVCKLKSAPQTVNIFC